nr:hypothetical protein Q903MT_gene517 [Picea sitchensis]
MELRKMDSNSLWSPSQASTHVLHFFPSAHRERNQGLTTRTLDLGAE